MRHSVRFSRRDDVQSFYFLADYHALIKVDEPARIQRSTLEIAATWLACGLDPERVTFYRQSDIPEIPELTWFLTCVTGKGLLNRAHAYKAAVDKNVAKGEDPDADVNAGLFMYPVLMGADILMFNAHKVPVGRDQVQHIEMARDMAQRFNHLYGEHFTLPEAEIDDAVATLPGLDGRKMSKSYDNTIPLFTPRAQLQKLIAGIVTDSRAPGRAQGHRGLGAVPDLPGLRRRRGNRGAAPGLRRRHRLGRRQAAAVRAHRPRNRADARALRGADQRPGADRAHPAAPAPRRRARCRGPSWHGCATPSACATWPSQRRRRRRARRPRWRGPASSNTASSDGLFYFKLLDASGGRWCKAAASRRRRRRAGPSARLQQQRARRPGAARRTARTARQ